MIFMPKVPSINNDTSCSLRETKSEKRSASNTHFTQSSLFKNSTVKSSKYDSSISLVRSCLMCSRLNRSIQNVLEKLDDFWLPLMIHLKSRTFASVGCVLISSLNVWFRSFLQIEDWQSHSFSMYKGSNDCSWAAFWDLSCSSVSGWLEWVERVYSCIFSVCSVNLILQIPNI